MRHKHSEVVKLYKTEAPCPPVWDHHRIGPVCFKNEQTLKIKTSCVEATKLTAPVWDVKSARSWMRVKKKRKKKACHNAAAAFQTGTPSGPAALKEA